MVKCDQDFNISLTATPEQKQRSTAFLLLLADIKELYDGKDDNRAKRLPE